MNQTDDDEALDGIKVDLKGNIFVSAPGGVWIFTAAGNYLGRIIGPDARPIWLGRRRQNALPHGSYGSVQNRDAQRRPIARPAN